MPKRERDYVVSSGNVFADLGLPNRRRRLPKRACPQITVLIQSKGLTQVQTAKLLGVDQPKVSALIRGRLSGFSLERLMRFLLLLGQDIKSLCRPALARGQGPGFWWHKAIHLLTSADMAPEPSAKCER